MYDPVILELDNLKKVSFSELEVWAVDFDGTLCKDAYPTIGEPNWPLIELLKEAQAEGVKLIMWTCRCGDRLTEARRWCAYHGVVWDTVNNNLPETIAHFRTESRKIYATLYIDDSTFGFGWWPLWKYRRILNRYKRRKRRVKKEKDIIARKQIYNTWYAKAEKGL